MAVLSDIEIQRELAAVPEWTRKGNEITRTYAFDGFPAAIEFVRALVPLAEGMNHHPDIDVRYDKVTIRLSTHSEGGVTRKDLELAKLIDGAGAA
jgi:4a-hydroxytetrahydrobiopterin dehydratase